MQARPQHGRACWLLQAKNDYPIKNVGFGVFHLIKNVLFVWNYPIICVTEVAIQWLLDAGVVYKTTRVSKISMPLKFYENQSDFKLFLLDVGLLGCMADIPAANILIRDNEIKEFKGMLTVNYMAQQIKAAGITPYYWSKGNSAAEIDFAIQMESAVWPIEVKAETNLRARSLTQYIKDNPGIRGLRFSMLGYEQWPEVTNIPLFAAEAYFEAGE